MWYVQHLAMLQDFSLPAQQQLWKWPFLCLPASAWSHLLVTAAPCTQGHVVDLQKSTEIIIKDLCNWTKSYNYCAICRFQKYNICSNALNCTFKGKKHRLSPLSLQKAIIVSQVSWRLPALSGVLDPILIGWGDEEEVEMLDAAEAAAAAAAAVARASFSCWALRACRASHSSISLPNSSLSSFT